MGGPDEKNAKYPPRPRHPGTPPPAWRNQTVGNVRRVVGMFGLSVAASLQSHRSSDLSEIAPQSHKTYRHHPPIATVGYFWPVVGIFWLVVAGELQFPIPPDLSQCTAIVVPHAVPLLPPPPSASRSPHRHRREPMIGGIGLTKTKLDLGSRTVTVCMSVEGSARAILK